MKEILVRDFQDQTSEQAKWVNANFTVESMRINGFPTQADRMHVYLIGHFNETVKHSFFYELSMDSQEVLAQYLADGSENPKVFKV